MSDPKESSSPTDVHQDIAQAIVFGALLEYTVSYAGRSQYSRAGGGISACGLAALNCARVIFSLEKSGNKDVRLLQTLMLQQTLEEILRPCLSWSSPTHLDVDDIRRAPIFRSSLNLLSNDYGQSAFRQFKQMLLHLTEHSNNTGCSTCAVITRPPEIIACTKVAIDQSDVFVIFDSHPRPDKHPQGAAFIFISSLEATATYLTTLLRYDQRLLTDNSLQWQAQLLAHFSAHLFSPVATIDSVAAMVDTSLKASLDSLSLRAQVTEMQNQNDQLIAENKRLLDKTSGLEAEISKLQGIRQHSWTSDHAHSSIQDQRYSRAPTVPATKMKGKGFYKESSGATDRRGRTKYRAGEAGQAKRPAYDSEAASSSSAESKSTIHNERANDMALAIALQFDPAFDPDSMYAARIQREFDEEHTRLATQFKDLQRIAPNVFECGICQDKFDEDVIARMERCGHHFCRECLRGHTVAKIEERRYPILCPTCMAEKTGESNGVVDQSLLEQLGLSENQYEVFVDMQMNGFSVIVHCRRCKNSVFVDKKEYEMAETVVCPLRDCNHVWCKACSQPIEVGGPKHSCDGSSELKHLMNQRGWKHCPGCQTPAEKIDGCSHMTCMVPGCNTHFCYKCGGAITQSVRQQEIQTAISVHYRRCQLFDNVA